MYSYYETNKIEKIIKNPYQIWDATNFSEYCCAYLVLSLIEQYFYSEMPEAKKRDIEKEDVLMLLRETNDCSTSSNYHREWYSCGYEDDTSRFDTRFNRRGVNCPDNITQRYVAFKMYPSDVRRRVVANILYANLDD